MDYSEEEIYALEEETAYQDEFTGSSNLRNAKTLTRKDLRASENSRAFKAFNDFLELGTAYGMEFKFGVYDDMPYFEFQTYIFEEEIHKLYLNKEIIKYITTWLAGRGLADEPTDLYDVQKKAHGDYVLYMIKNDINNGADFAYDTQTSEYKSTYRLGTINYGKLPYTQSEITAKIDEL